MKKLLSLLTVLCLLLTMTAAVAEEKLPEELDIRALIWKYDDTYGSTVRVAMEKWADYYAKELGIKINFKMYDANDDMAKQIEQATILTSEKPDFVIINLAEVTNGQVLVDTGTIFIGTLARQAGDMQGEILADLYKKDPSIDLNGDGVLQYVMLMGEPQNDEAIARSRYSVETAEANGLKLEQIGQTLVCNWDQAQAQDAINAVWSANPDGKI